MSEYYHIRAATELDAKHLAPRLRPADLRELAAASEGPAEDVLWFCLVASSHAFAVCNALDRPEILFGVAPSADEGVAEVWLMGSDFIDRNPVMFLRDGREILRSLTHLYPTLIATPDTRNTVHLRWLEWLGFVTKDVFPVGPTLFATLVLESKPHV